MEVLLYFISWAYQILASETADNRGTTNYLIESLLFFSSLTLAGPKHFTRISKIMARQTRNVSLGLRVLMFIVRLE